MSILTQSLNLLEKASNQRHIKAIKDGMIGVVPLILVGSVFLILFSFNDIIQDYFPTIAASSIGQLLNNNLDLVILPFRLTMGVIGLFLCYTVSFSLATTYKLPQPSASLTAVATYIASLVPHSGVLDEVRGPFLALRKMGAEGMFPAIIIALLSIELVYYIHKKTQKDDKESSSQLGIPPEVAQAFHSFLPLLSCITLIFIIRHVLGFDLHESLHVFTEPLKKVGDTLTGVWVSNLFLHLFGAAGVHGISLVNAVMLPIWQQFVIGNAEAHLAGEALPYVTAYPFFQFFVWAGGSGATLAPTIILCFSRQPFMKKIGRLSLVPAFFNINEPLLFGLPVVLNPILMLPYIIAPLACGTVSFMAISQGFVRAPFLEAPWIMPPFIGGPLATGDYFNSIVLVVVNLIIAGVIWWPFLKQYEEKLKQEESSQEVSHES